MEHNKLIFSKVPTLRFKRYTTEWTKINLSNYLFVSSKRNKDGRFSKEDVLSVSGELGIVNQIALLGRSYAGESVLPYHIVEKGDIVYTKSPLALYPYGIIKTNRNKVGIVSTLYAVYKTKDNANNRFIEHYFSLKSRINNYLKPIVRIGAKHDMKIGNNEVLENIVAFPDISEQCEIADFLDLLDNRISVQNKIISKYETLIKGLYTQIQSKSAKKEYRICDIVKCHSVGLLSKENLTESGSKKCILYGELFTTYDEVINEIKSRTNVDGYISQGNEILFPSSTTVDAMSLIAPSALNEKGILLGGDMFVLELLPGFNNEYISYYLNTIAKRNLAKYAQGTTITHLYFEHIKNVLLYLPDITIQLSVASKMRKLKTKIQIEKEMLSALQKQKAFLLQSMFI